MKKYYLVFLFLFRNGIGDIYAQEIPLKHQIRKGETIEVIARKYDVNPSDIYNVNPGLRQGFKEDDLIIIPQPNASFVYHIVQANETKYGLSKKYNISIQELERQNPQIISMLQKGHELKIQGKAMQNNSSVARISNYSSDNGSNLIHIVEKGESLWGISRKYKVTINQIVEENSINVDDFLQIGQSLKIPTDRRREEDEVPDGNYYIVKAGETKYGLSKRFDISIAQLENLNPQIVAMLRTGQKIILPQTMNKNTVGLSEVVVSRTQEVQKQEVQKTENSAYEIHIVEVGETKHGLSKKFGTTISELENLNPHIVAMLNTGQEIRVPKNSVADQKKVQETTENLRSTEESQQIVSENDTETKRNSEVDNVAENLISYKVKPQETMYGISKMAGWSQQKLVEINPELNNGLKAGMILRIPSGSAVPTLIEKALPEVVTQSSLLKSIKKQEKKEIAFLMPFSEEEYIQFIKFPKKESSQNKTYLDFYSGATLAIDSLKKMNVSIVSKIFKIKNSNSSETDFSDLVQNDIDKYNTVIYPIDEYRAENLGDYLSQKNIPLIVSEANETSVGSATTYRSVPSNSYLRELILDYLFSKNENVIIVNDPSRAESRSFITENYPNAQFVKFDKKGVFDSESLKVLLSTTKKNYVVLDTDKAGLILTTTTLLLQESNEYDVQIALLEPKDFIKEEKLSDMRFKVLKMIYPSVHNPENKQKINIFQKDFKIKYGFEPSQEAVKGFDITFDALLRLFQDDNFETVAQEYKTEQLDFKFQYFKNLEGGYFNAGGYILQYDEDTNAKIINE